MEILKVILILLEVLLLFNLLIFVHELGHFLAGRWRGLKIDRFALWFGKPIWSKKINGVEYAMGWIPAGGYVSLPQMGPMEVIEGKVEGEEGAPQEELPPVSAMDKIIVAFAGPLFSFLLAVAFALVVWGVQRPVSEAEASTTIGYVEEGGPADQAGLAVGDRVISIDDRKVTKFGGMGSSISWRVVSSEGETISVVVERNKKQLPPIEVKPVVPDRSFYQRKGLRQIGIAPAVSTMIGRVVENGPAAMAGLKAGDEIVDINGLKPVHFGQVAEYIKGNSGELLKLQIVRDDETLNVELTPEVPLEPADSKPAIGIEFSVGGKIALVRPGPVEQVVGSVMAMVDTFSALFSRKSDVSPQHLGGAIKIINVYYILFQSEQGWRQALWFSVLMNVNLAILNLLPLPVLDGGHITFAIVEAIRKRPVSAKFVQYMYAGCGGLLILFMLWIAAYDVQDLAGGKAEVKELKFNPKPASEFRPIE